MASVKKRMPQKRSLKMFSAVFLKRWHPNIELGILNWNTKNVANNCPQFQGSIPHIILDHKLELKYETRRDPATISAEDLLRRSKFCSIEQKRKSCSHKLDTELIWDTKAKILQLQKRLLLHNTTKNRSPRIKNTSLRLQMDWIFRSRIVVSKKNVLFSKLIQANPQFSIKFDFAGTSRIRP